MFNQLPNNFYSKTESIRDVQFSPHQTQTFAAVSENGNVQLWDLRKVDRCLSQFTAHSGPIFACDWHPEMSWLATASRDKTIKVDRTNYYFCSFSKCCCLTGLGFVKQTQSRVHNSNDRLRRSHQVETSKKVPHCQLRPRRGLQRQRLGHSKALHSICFLQRASRCGHRGCLERRPPHHSVH